MYKVRSEMLSPHKPFVQRVFAYAESLRGLHGYHVSKNVFKPFFPNDVEIRSCLVNDQVQTWSFGLKLSMIFRDI